MTSNFAPLQDIRLRNLSDFDFDVSRSLKVKCSGGIGLSIYGFLLIYTITTGLSLTDLIGTRNVSYLEIEFLLPVIAALPSYKPIFKIDIFGHDTWSLEEVPEVAHTLFGGTI